MKKDPLEIVFTGKEFYEKSSGKKMSFHKLKCVLSQKKLLRKINIAIVSKNTFDVIFYFNYLLSELRKLDADMEEHIEKYRVFAHDNIETLLKKMDVEKIDIRVIFHWQSPMC